MSAEREHARTQGIETGGGLRCAALGWAAREDAFGSGTAQSRLEVRRGLTRADATARGPKRESDWRVRGKWSAARCSMISRAIWDAPEKKGDDARRVRRLGLRLGEVRRATGDVRLAVVLDRL